MVKVDLRISDLILSTFAAGLITYAVVRSMGDEKQGEYVPFTSIGNSEAVDLNGDGRLEETLFHIGGTPYVLQWGYDGNPTFVPYEMRQTEE